MTILTETERVNAKERWEQGWSFWRISEELLLRRSSNICFDVAEEVKHVVLDTKEEPFGSEIRRKRLARGDVEEDGIIRRQRAGQGPEEVQTNALKNRYYRTVWDVLKKNRRKKMKLITLLLNEGYSAEEIRKEIEEKEDER